MLFDILSWNIGRSSPLWAPDPIFDADVVPWLRYQCPLRPTNFPENCLLRPGGTTHSSNITHVAEIKTRLPTLAAESTTPHVLLMLARITFNMNRARC